MPGQPNVFDCAIVIASEAGAPLIPPYSIIEAPGDTLTLRSYFHCGGPDRVKRDTVSNCLTGGGATVTVRYYFQDLQAQAIAAPPAFEPGGAITKLTTAEIEAEFRPGGDLHGSKLDPTDDYYRSADTPAAISTAAGGKLALPAGTVNGTWRVLTALHGVNGADKVSAFDDSMVIHVQG